MLNVINDNGVVMNDDELAEMTARMLSGLLVDVVVHSDKPDDVKIAEARDQGNRFAAVVADMFGHERGGRIMSAALAVMLAKIREPQAELATA